MPRDLLTLACLLFAACNAPTGVGNPCTVAADCERGQICATEAGGFCTKPCSIDGNTTECPLSSICTSFQTSLYCSDICTSKADCRDQYDCVGVSTTTTKACKPIRK